MCRHSARAKAIELASIALRWSSGAPRPDEEWACVVRRRRRWTVINKALRGEGGTHSLIDDLGNFNDPIAPSGKRCHAITYAYGCRGLRGCAVHPDVAA